MGRLHGSVVLGMRRDRARRLSYRAISQKWGVPLRTCHRAVRGQGHFKEVTRWVRSPMVNPDQAAAMRAAYREYNNFQLVGDEFGVNRHLARKVVKGIGVYGSENYR